MTSPPDDLKRWSKNALVRELTRLRALLREHGALVGDDPREHATDGNAVVDVAGDPYAQDGVLLDMRRSVLLDSVDVSLVDTKAPGGSQVVCVLVLGGRVNYSPDEVQHAYLLSADGAAALVVELLALARRAGRGDPDMRDYAQEYDEAMARHLDSTPS